MSSLLARASRALVILCLMLGIVQAGEVTRSEAADWQPPDVVESGPGRTIAYLSQPRSDIGAAVTGDIVVLGGGRTDGTPSAVVDLFDGENGTWSTARLSEGRIGAETAVLDDIVLVAGGIDRTGRSSAVVDIYDLTSDTWSATTLSRPWDTSPRDARGRVRYRPPITVVGMYALFVHADIVDIFDRETRSWSQHPLPEPRRGASVAVVQDLVVIAGGDRLDGTPSAAVDMFDASPGTWQSASLSLGRSLIATVVVEPTVIFAGGIADGVPVSVADVYDAVTNQWSATTVPSRKLSPAESPPYQGVAAGRFGVFVGGQSLSTFDTFDRTWQERPWYSAAAYWGNLYTAGSKAVLVQQLAPPNVNVHTFDPSTGSWSTGPFGGTHTRFAGGSRRFGAVTALGSSLVLAGGEAASRASAVGVDLLDVYDTKSGAWSTGQLSERTGQVSATSQGSHIVLATGAGVDTFDATTGAWSAHELAPRRYTPPAVAIAGRYVVVAGGAITPTMPDFSHIEGLPGVTDNTDVLDTTTGIWTRTHVSQARREISVASVGSTALLIGGSDVRPQISDVVDLYNRATGQWTSTRHPEHVSTMRSAPVASRGRAFLPSPAYAAYVDADEGVWHPLLLSQPREGATLAVVGSTIVVAGGSVGRSGNVVGTVDLFDLATGEHRVARLSEPRRSPRAAVIGSRLFLIGGETPRHPGDAIALQPTTTIDIYDDSTQRWSTSSVPHAPRGGALVIGSTILVTGTGDQMDGVDVYDADAGTWSSARLADGSARQAVVVGDRIVFTAFANDSAKPTSAVSVYNHATGSWLAASRPSEQPGPAISVGGRWAVQRPIRGEPRLEVFDAETATWSEYRSPDGRVGNALAAVGRSIVLTGGGVGLQTLNLATGTWSEAPLSHPRHSPGVAVVGNTVVVAGGSQSAAVDIFDLSVPPSIEP